MAGALENGLASPYRAGLGIDAALAEISRHRGSSFDAATVDACIGLFREHGYRLEGGPQPPAAVEENQL